MSPRYDLDDKAAVRAILLVEDDFNVALDRVVEFLGSRSLLDVGDKRCLSIRDILLLKHAHARLRCFPLDVVAEQVASDTLLSFCEVDSDGS